MKNAGVFRQGLLLAAVLLLTLSGCATVKPDADAEVPAAEPLAAQPEPIAPEPKVLKPEDYPVAPFEGDSLYQLLVAEIAGYRSRYDVALEKYLYAARETGDPGVAARATRLALYLKNDDIARQTLEIWTAADPDNIDAHRYAVDLLLREGDLTAAIEHMEAVKQLGGPARFEVFAYRAANLPADERASLLAVVSEMVQRHPDDEQLRFAQAILLEQSGRNEESLALAETLLLNSDEANLIVLKMSLLDKLERRDEALAYMREAVTAQPENRRLRLILGRMLFERNEMTAAREAYLQVLEQAPNDGDVLFALALIALQQEDDVEAKRYFERMVRWNRRAGEAHYYLGGIAERASDAATALKEYRQVGTGYEFLPAQARIAALLVDDGQLEEARAYLDRVRTNHAEHAMQLVMIEAQLLSDRGLEQEVLAFLDEVLVDQPENIDLLYFRAMTGERFDRLDVLEYDLRRILEIDPENADALNALGYTLTDRTDRHAEALLLIEEALALKPDEPAFIDSMGWVQYRLKNYEVAIEYLRRALSLFQNDEVAAHLGEVLWITGEKTEAREVWNKALELAPESEILQDVMRRFRED
ncbi:MAG: tetratricopeptide repeat protein [Gammaproteobacteria bacterium]